MDNQNFDFGSGRPEDRDRYRDDAPGRGERSRDDAGRDHEPPKTFPAIVMVAGLVWMAVGAVGVFGNIVGMANGGGGNPKAPGESIGNCCGFVFAIAFLSCGFQTVRGTAADTRGNSFGSIIFGMLQVIAAATLGFGAFAAQQKGPAGDGVMVLMVFVGLMGGSLIVAGILGIAGRSDYLAWREQAHPKPRKSPRRDERDRYER